MVGNQDAVEAMIDREPRVLAGIDALDDELAFPERPQPIDERPVHGRVLRRHAVHIDTVVHSTFLDGGSGLPVVTAVALREIFWPRPQIRFAVAAGCVVDRECDDGAAGCLYPAQQLLARRPRAGRVQLIPDRPAERGVHVFDAGRRGRRENLQRTACFRGPRHGDFAFRMERLLTSGRTKKNRAGVRRAEQLDARVDLRRVMKSSRPELNVLESFAVGPQRCIVIDAARHIRPVSRRDLAARRLFKIHDAQGLGGALNRVEACHRLVRPHS